MSNFGVDSSCTCSGSMACWASVTCTAGATNVEFERGDLVGRIWGAQPYYVPAPAAYAIRHAAHQQGHRSRCRRISISANGRTACTPSGHTTLVPNAAHSVLAQPSSE
ncbi:unnamed protein product [Prorocentrum cordatum]|uniref:Uncharacterized protein n=1 Tax=Prorocentrum cordatum TaxID=2364126 RepID=A0ABN9Y0F0_9DINO|nr:unnamed protein product [Polarella glacialis]